MSHPPVQILGFAALLPEGMLTAAGHSPWEADQQSVADVRRGQVLDKPHLNFGKLTVSDRLSFAAACLLLRSAPSLDGPRTGIAIGMPWGSLSADIRFMESVVGGFPSPAIFSATLPSSAIAEIAIYYKLQGPNRVVSQPYASGLVALEAAERVIRSGKADAMIAVALTAIEPQDRTSPLLAGTTPRPDAAFAFLLGKGPGGTPFSITMQPAGHAENSQPEDVYLRSLVERLQSRRTGAIAVTARGWFGKLVLGE